jgi:hypothetical protein
MNKTAANAKAWALFHKLLALAEQGVDGEKMAAQNKLARLQQRYDFSVPLAGETSDLFSGNFKRSASARRIYSFRSNELDIASSVKWAIESAAKIPCLHRDTGLYAEATASTARKLTEIADHITQSFRILLDKFSAVEGVRALDRSAFLQGLYDGMMNEARTVGQRLPGPSQGVRKRKAKKPAASGAPGMRIHPYTMAVDLGKQIRFSASMDKIAGELEAAVRKGLAQGSEPAS